MTKVFTGLREFIVRTLHFRSFVVCLVVLLVTLSQKGEQAKKPDTIMGIVAPGTIILAPPPTTTPTPPAFTCNYYASPTGTANGSGSNTSPWNLQTALNKTAQVTAGKTLCLRGGTYYGKFISTLNGGTVRSYPGERATIDGNATTTLNGAINAAQGTIVLASAAALVPASTIAVDAEIMQVDHTVGNTVYVNRGWDGTAAVSHSNGAAVRHAGSQLTVLGSNTTYRDFEITNSDLNRDSNGDSNNQFAIKVRGTGLSQPTGNGNSYINLIVHDNVTGIFIGSSTSNTLLYGCLTYNNGTYNPARGHGLYLENASGYSRIYDTVVLNNFNLGTQAYGVTGPYVGGDFQGSVFAGSGTPMGERHYNLIYGPDSVASPTGTVNACHFYHTPNTNSYSLKFGYGAGVTSGTVTNNYFVGSGTAFEAGEVANLTFAGNKFYSTGTSDVYVISRALAFNWNNNSYFNTSIQERFAIPSSGVPGTYPNWRTLTGFDTSSTLSSSAMPNTVIVRPNAYEAGRASIVTYAPSSPSSINVNLSPSGLVNGQAYAIRNAFNYNGPNVLTGVYNSTSSTVSVPLNGAALTVATPFGMSLTPPTSCPGFCVFIVVPTTSAPPTTPTPTNTPTPTPTGPAITGTVTYGNAIGAQSARFVSNVLISGAGSPPVSALTGFPGGTYSVSGFGTGSYTLTPSKIAPHESAINSFDAAMITGYVAGHIMLNPTQQIVADVTGNGIISSFDAGAIISYVTSSQTVGMTGTWRFSPASRAYASITGNIAAQDYTALLVGEVSGNWTNTGSRPSGSGGPERDIAITAPRLTTPANHEVLIPVTIEGAANKGIISYEFDLRYDPSVIQPQANSVDLATTVSRGFSAGANIEESGLLRVAVYGAMPLNGDGVLLKLRFNAIGAPGSRSPLTWERMMLNEGTPGTKTTDGLVELSGFNPSVNMWYPKNISNST